MADDLGILFDELLREYILTIESNYLFQIKRAKNKPYVQNKLMERTRAIMRTYARGIGKFQKPFYFFLENYNSGEPIERILEELKEKNGDIFNIEQVYDDREDVELIPFGTKEEKIIREIPSVYKKLISFVAGYLALEEISKAIPNYLNEISKRPLQPKSGITFTPSVKENKNEFVQMIYALHEAGLLNHGKGEITKIVESLAEILQVELGKNWQSNHSASIHKSKRDYVPPVFDKIREAYLKYASSLSEEKKKKS